MPFMKIKLYRFSRLFHCLAAETLTTTLIVHINCIINVSFLKVTAVNFLFQKSDLY